ncbi:MAG: inner-rane translocator [Actinomycetia bacterium]|nr:inner-rane translocator [Actinomycetes bacterium]
MQHLTYLFFGLGNGGVYAALALALVLTYRSSGVVNFATGAMALYAAYTYAGLREGQLIVPIPGLPARVDVGGSDVGFVLAALIALVLVAILGALLHLAVFRPLRDAPPLARAVASLGVLVVLQELMAIRFGTTPVSVRPIFPAHRWEVGSLTFLSDRFYLALTVVALAIAIAALYRWTRFGLATRAAAETQTGAFVSGVSPDRVALFNWMISAAVAGAAGILIAPLSPLTPITYTLFVIPALGAAVVGGFAALVPTVIGGITIGMLQSEGGSLAAQHSWLPRTGSAELVPLIVILVALLVTGRAMPVRGLLVRQPLGRAPRPRGLALPTIGGFLVGVVALVVTDDNWRGAVIGTFIFAVIALSLVVVTGYAGQVSLAQMALAGVGAFTLSFLTQSWNIPFPLAPLLAALVSTVIGVLVGLPALRLRGLTLGVVTLALAFAIEGAWFRNTQIVSSQGATAVQPELFGIDLSVGVGKAFPRIEFGLLCLVTLVAVAWCVARLRTSKLGSAMLAVRANERSAAGIGVNVTLVKVASFAIASFIAGLGGSLLAYRRGTVTFDSFSTITNLLLLSTVYLAGVTSVYGGVLAGILASGGIVFYATDQWVSLGKWFPTISSILLIVTLLAHPEGLASTGHALADRLARFRRSKGHAPPDPVAAAPPSEPVEVGGRVLDVADLTVRYGGVVAVSEVSLHVEAGTVVGLIGPNGAGKTSVIDAITGFAAARGSVEVVGERVDGMRPYRRVRAGVARTFQSLELYDDLTVGENVSAAAAAARGDARRDAVDRALDLVGISALHERTAGELSQGERQLVSIARACAADPQLLLLDEPAAGLDTTETKWLGERIRTIAASGVGVLLVDHDVALVLSVCDHIYVLDFGQVIAEGDSAAIRADRTVAAAYLGTIHDSEEVTTG